jgi:hypothetical protein
LQNQDFIIFLNRIGSCLYFSFVQTAPQGGFFILLVLW